MTAPLSEGTILLIAFVCALLFLAGFVPLVRAVIAARGAARRARVRAYMYRREVERHPAKVWRGK